MTLDSQAQLIEYAYYITPDGIEYPLFGGQRALMGWQSFGMPEINFIQDRGPFQNGVTVRDYRLEPRVINLDLYERGRCREDFWCNEAALVDALRPNRSSTAGAGKLLVIRPDWTQLEIPARIMTGPAGDWSGQAALSDFDYRETLRLFCPDPIWRRPDAVEASVTISVASSCLSFCLPQSIGTGVVTGSRDITYCGTWDGDTLTITIGGPIIGPTITNTTTGKTIVLDYSIAAGENVVISITPTQTTVENNSGTNLIGSIGSISDLVTFYLAARGDLTATGVNTISVGGAGANEGVTGFAISFYERHIAAFVPCLECVSG